MKIIPTSRHKLLLVVIPLGVYDFAWMEDLGGVAVQPDLELLEAVFAQRDGVAIPWSSPKILQKI